MRLVNRFCLVILSAAAIASATIVANAQQQPPPPPQQQAQPEPGRPAVGGFPVGPPGKILELRADPATIQPGQTTTLHWHAVNADDTYFDNCLGIVPTFGSHEVTPKQTTTYTFTVKGRAGGDSKSVTVTVAGTQPASASVTGACGDPHNQPVPRSADGHPDLSGVYIAGFSLRPVDNIQVKPGAESFKIVPKEDDLGQGVTCVPPGVPAATMQPYPLQIIQKPGLVVILYEAYHIFRVIPTDGSTHPDDLDPTYMGNSVGHWDGDTLVVDVTGFNDKTFIGNYKHSTSYHVVERYHRVSYEELDYSATMDDPNVWAGPWTMSSKMRLHPEWQIQEYVCEDNNKDYKDLLESK
jgi:hypothetical protein